MYSFKQFLTENAGVDKTLEEIISECQPYIQQSKGEFIFRGIKHPFGEFQIIGTDITAYKMDVRMDRHPRDSDQFTHDESDKFLRDKFGIAGRSQALFVTASPSVAEGYGPVYVILPRGEFRFVWSPKIGDLYGIEFDSREDAEQAMTDFEYQTTDLHDAIESRNEIMIACRDYYAIPYNRSFIKLWMEAVNV